MLFKKIYLISKSTFKRINHSLIQQIKSNNFGFEIITPYL
jgi:hypothetical protein